MITFKQFATIDINGIVTPTAEGEMVLQIVKFFTQSTPNRQYSLSPIGMTKNGSICWGIVFTDYTGSYLYSPVHDYLSRTAIDKIIYYAEHEFIGWDVDRPVPLLPAAELDATVEKARHANLMLTKPTGLVYYLYKRIEEVFGVDLNIWIL
jgi:hypothetical protein